MGVLSIVWAVSGGLWLMFAADQSARGGNPVLVLSMLLAAAAMFAVAATSESARRDRLVRLAEAQARLDEVEDRLRRAVHGSVT